MDATAVPLSERRPISFVRLGVGVISIGILYFQRLGFPLGTQFVPICLAFALLGMGVIAAGGTMTISRWRIETWMATVACMIFTIFMQSGTFSTLSFFFLLVSYTPLVLIIGDASEEEYKSGLLPFQWALIPIALLGVYQFLSNDVSDPIKDHFGNWVVTGYQTHPYLNPTSQLHRSNGYFLLEPSSLSQTCAVALLMELTFFHSRWRSAVYAAGLVAAASGSGLVMFAVFLATYAWRHNKVPHVVGVVVVGLLAMWALSSNPIVSTLASRTTEISETGSSAYVRFLAPFIQASYQLGDDLSHWVIGQGPGASNPDRLLLAGWSVDQLGGGIAIVKMLVEYGLLGAIPFGVFLAGLFFGDSRSQVVSLALFLGYMFMSSALQSPHIIFLYYLVLMLFPRPSLQPVN